MDYQDSGDRILIKSCLNADKKAWDAFVEKYSQIIKIAIERTLIKYSPGLNKEIVEEVFQSVFLSLIENNFKKLRQFSGKSKLSTWLFTISINKTIDYLRINTKHSACGDEAVIERTPSRNPSQQEVVEKTEEKKLFEKLKTDLTGREQFFVELFYMRELSVKEIAKIMYITPNNVYQLKNLVTEKLKELLKKYL